MTCCCCLATSLQPRSSTCQKVVKATVFGPLLAGPPDCIAWSPMPTLMLVKSDWPARPRCSSRLPAQAAKCSVNGQGMHAVLLGLAQLLRKQHTGSPAAAPTAASPTIAHDACTGLRRERRTVFSLLLGTKARQRTPASPEQVQSKCTKARPLCKTAHTF